MLISGRKNKEATYSKNDHPIYYSKTKLTERNLPVKTELRIHLRYH